MKHFKTWRKESEVAKTENMQLPYLACPELSKLNPLNSRLHELLHWAMHQARTGAIELSRLLSVTFQSLSVSRASPSALAAPCASRPFRPFRPRALAGGSLFSCFAFRETRKQRNEQTRKEKGIHKLSVCIYIRREHAYLQIHIWIPSLPKYIFLRVVDD